MSKTIKDHAINASYLIKIVPCNVSGVVRSFNEWLIFCRSMDLSIEQRNTHPITLAYIAGLCSIFGEYPDYFYKDDLSKILSEIINTEKLI